MEPLAVVFVLIFDFNRYKIDFLRSSVDFYKSRASGDVRRGLKRKRFNLLTDFLYTPDGTICRLESESEQDESEENTAD